MPDMETLLMAVVIVFLYDRGWVPGTAPYKIRQAGTPS